MQHQHTPLPPAGTMPLSGPEAGPDAGPGAGIEALRRACLEWFPGRIAAVSSFGAESALLLALLAEIDPGVPVLFLDTGMHFPETLAYRHALAAHLGLTSVRDVRAEAIPRRDPEGQLHAFDTDACCALRKVEPLEAALAPFAAWITGRKRGQASTRAAMPVVEHEDGRAKINPLADWTAAAIEAEMARRGLPRHPLAARGYPSIGCAPCTRAVGPGEDPRAGRWSGSGKVECGIHRPASTLQTTGNTP